MQARKMQKHAKQYEGTSKQSDLASEDRLFGGALRLLQPKSGHRAGTDAVLLVACLPGDARFVADLGAASGVVGLRAAQMEPAAHVTLIEREPKLIDLAQSNIKANALEGRVEAVLADVLALGGDIGLRERFDCILTNPPFYRVGTARASPKPGKAAAHHFASGETLDGWLRNATAILAPGGRLVMIHAADCLPEVLVSAEGRLGGLRLRFVHPRVDQAAVRVLVAARKGSRAPLRVLPPLVLNAGNAFTPETEAIHRGERRISMPD